MDDRACIAGAGTFLQPLIEKMVFSAIHSLPAVPDGPHRVLLFAPKGEMHELPLLFVQFILKKKGIKTVLLGRNCTLEMIQYCCAQQPVTHLYLHFMTNFMQCDPVVYLAELSEQLPTFKLLRRDRLCVTFKTRPAI